MSAQTTPEVTWAQRSSSSTPDKNVIYLTIVAPDVPTGKAKINLQPTSVEFTGTSETKKTTYHVKLDFYAEIDVQESKQHHSDRDVAFILRKKDHKDEYWPRLTKEKQRLHFLKTDFDKWVDEDEQDAVDDEAMMGGLGGGMGGMGADGGFGGIDFSKLGGGGLPDMGDMGDEDGEEDDDDMPDLEDEEGSAAASSSKSKIEEVN